MICRDTTQQAKLVSISVLISKKGMSSKRCSTAKNNGVKPNSSGVLLCLHVMQNRCRDELAKHLPVILMSRELLVRYVWKGRRWWLKCGRSSPVCDGAQIGSAPPPACFTTERHCRWEGRVRRGLRARRHTHTPPDRDTRSRRGRQPLRTPREGRTALWEDRQPHTAASSPSSSSSEIFSNTFT